MSGKRDSEILNLNLNINEILKKEGDIVENEQRNKNNKKDVVNYFEVIDEFKIQGWENKLNESKLPIRDFSKVNDADILSEEFNDQKIIRVMRSDIERTRVQETRNLLSFKDYVYQLIIYYMNQNKVTYKQGLNEIAGPFIILKYHLQISFRKIYNMFVCFIDKFLTNYFQEFDFYSLKSSLSLINLLLRYHDPELFHLFEDSMITPDLYATSWLLTLFSNKCALHVVYQLWDKLILFDDNMFPHFFITAYLIKSKNKLFEIDSTYVLSVLSHLHIDTIDEVNDILDFATEIRDRTPNSFYLLANKLEIFNFNSSNLQNLYEEIKPDKMLALPIFPTELLSITHQDLFGCINEKCINFLKTEKQFNKRVKCIFCRSKTSKPALFYIIIDLRIFEDEDREKKAKKPKLKNEFFSSSFPGFLPKTINVTKEELDDKQFPKNILEQYQADKDTNHFIIITSETNYFDKYEKEYYKEKDNDKGSCNAGIFFKLYKELDKEKADNLGKKNKNSKNYILLKEFDYYKRIIYEMNKEGFKYVSFAYRGYKNVHSAAMKYNIELLEHKKNCFLCEEEKKNENVPSFLKFLI